MARQIALIPVCIAHDRGISVGVSDCHQNRSASNEPPSVGVLSTARRSAAGALSEFRIRAIVTIWVCLLRRESQPNKTAVIIEPKTCLLSEIGRESLWLLQAKFAFPFRQ